jgi:hypothetical protein
MNILYPPMALIGLTFFCIVRLGYLRFVAVRDRTVDLRYYSSYQGYEEPEKLRVHSRHVINLFEVPVLFYAIALIAYVSGSTSSIAVLLAWIYTGLRFVHTFVHLTSNVILLRFRIFAFSVFTLIALWVVVGVNLLRQ